MGFLVLPEWQFLSGAEVGNQHSVLSGTPWPGGRGGAAYWRNSQGHLYMFGGFGIDHTPTEQPHLLDDLWFLNTTSLQWTPILIPDGKLSPSARRGAVACGVGDMMLMIFGGEGPQGIQLQDTWAYNLKKGYWIALNSGIGSPNMTVPPGRTDPLLWCGRNLVIYGGHGPHGQRLADMWEISLRDLKWRPLNHDTHTHNQPSVTTEAVSWLSRNGSQYTWYLANGCVVWVYNRHSQTWSQVPRNPDSDCAPAVSGSATWWDPDKQLWLYGGEQSPDQPVSDLWSYNLTSHCWRHHGNITARGSQGRHMTARSHSVSWGTQGRKYLFGGVGLDGRGQLSYLSDLWVLTSPQATVTIHSKTVHITGLATFLISLTTFGGLVMVVGAGFCMKKYLWDYPRHRPSKEYNVKYSPLQDDGTLDFDM